MKLAVLGEARNSFALRHLVFCIIGLGIAVAAPGDAWASAGCTAFIGTYSGGATTGSTSGTGFSAGDVITLTTNAIGGGNTIGLYDITTNAILINSATTVVGTRTYTVPANTTDNFIISGTQSSASSNFAWSCAAGATTTGSTDSQNLTSVQTQGSTVAANVSGSAISSATDSATNTQLTQGSSGSGSGQGSSGSGQLQTPLSQDQFVALVLPKLLAAIANGTSTGDSYIDSSVSITKGIVGPYSQNKNYYLNYYKNWLATLYNVRQNSFSKAPFASSSSYLGFTWQTVSSTSSSASASNYAAEQPSAAARRANEAFAQLGNGVLVTKAPGKVQYLSGLWSVWGDLAGAGFDQSSGGAMHGNQINATAGIGYKLRPNVVVGLFGGYENFNYDFTALAGRLKGDGGTIGGYAGWAITPTLRWNTMLGWTGLSYDGTASTAAGSFGGLRWLFSTGLTGSYRVQQFVLEPSAMIYALTEHQSAYTDTLGALHASRDFSTGRVSLGGRAILPAQVNTPLGITPYVGLYGDYRFASDSTVVAGFPFVGISDGWSARVAGGLSMPVFRAGTLSLGGDYGGIGADYKVWTGKAQVNVPF